MGGFAANAQMKFGRQNLTTSAMQIIAQIVHVEVSRKLKSSHPPARNVLSEQAVKLGYRCAKARHLR